MSKECYSLGTSTCCLVGAPAAICHSLLPVGPDALPQEECIEAALNYGTRQVYHVLHSIPNAYHTDFISFPTQVLGAFCFHATMHLRPQSARSLGYMQQPDMRMPADHDQHGLFMQQVISQLQNKGTSELGCIGAPV